MSPARYLPDEIVLHIFEDVADRQPDVFDLRHRCARQVDLASLARVCRTWTPIAQSLLFTEICVVPRRADDSAPFAFSAERSSRQLAATLRNLTFDGSPLPGLVRTLHLGVMTDCYNSISYSREYLSAPGSTFSQPAFALIAEIVGACRNLRHLDLTIGCGSKYSFTDAQLRTMSHSLQQLRHVSARQLHYEHDDETCMDNRGVREWLLLSRLLPLCTTLECLSCYTHPLGNDGVGPVTFEWPASLVKFCLTLPSPELEASLLLSTRNIRSFVIARAGGGTFLSVLSVEDLTFVHLNEDEEFDYLRDVSSLRTFRCADDRPDEVLPVLRCLPPSVQRLSLRASAVAATDFLDTIVHFSNLVEVSIISTTADAAPSAASSVFAALNARGTHVTQDTTNVSPRHDVRARPDVPAVSDV